MSNDDKRKCIVENGLFVKPCDTLSKAVDNNIPGFSKVKGIFRQELTNIKTHKPSRTYFGIKTKEFKNGLLFNFCPWCGEQIDEPFAIEPENKE